MSNTKKFSLSALLMRMDCESLAVLTMALMAIQPLYGIFDIVREQTDLIALFYGKSVLIRFVGIFGLFLGFVNWYQKTSMYGVEYTRRKLLKNPWNLLFLLFLLWSVLASVNALNPEYAFFSYAYRYEGLLSYLAYAGIFMAGSMIRDPKKRQRLIDFTLIVAAVLVFFTWLSQQNGNETTVIARNGWVGDWSGTFINTNHYGYYLALILMLSAGRLVSAETVGGRILFSGSFLINTLILLKNNSFGPYLAVSVGLVGYFCVISAREGFKKSAWLVIPVILFFGTDALFNEALMIRTYGTIVNEFLEVVGVVKEANVAGTGVAEALQQEEGVGSGRMRIWLAAFDVWKQHLWTGCGPENVPMAMYDTLQSAEAVHNEYLQVLAEMGIIGFVLYFGGHIWFFVRNIRRAKKTDMASLIAYGAVATYLVSAAFGITITVSEVFFFFVLGLANASHTNEVMDSLEADFPSQSAGLSK